MKGIPEPEMTDVLPAITTPADSGGSGGVGFTKARMIITESWTHASSIPYAMFHFRCGSLSAHGDSFPFFFQVHFRVQIIDPVNVCRIKECCIQTAGGRKPRTIKKETIYW